MNLYRHSEWKKFREEVIKLDGGKCKRCRRSRLDGVVLQVHHKTYAAGLLPWDYNYDQCETLCKGCHAEEHGIIAPQSGWDLIGSDDLGDLIGECDYCGAELRYTYLINHPKWPTMEVGTVCCDKLTCTSEASQHHSEQIRRENKLKRFLSSSRWKAAPDGTIYIRRSNIDFSIAAVGEKFRIFLDLEGGVKDYESLMDAKIKIFELIETGEGVNFLNKIYLKNPRRIGAQRFLKSVARRERMRI